MTQARVRWFVALIAVPAVLGALALLWAGPPGPAAPSVARAGGPPAGAAPVGAAPAGPEPVVAADPTPGATPATTADPAMAEVLATQPIRFTGDSAELVGPAADTVQRVAKLLVAAPAAPVLVEGYVAETPGGPDAVQRLSDQRAAVVAAALVAAGVPAERITARGLGATRPLATVEESRRVEITFG